jgi:hypothetical protein
MSAAPSRATGRPGTSSGNATTRVGIGFINDLDGNEEPEPPNVPEIIPQPFVATSPPCGSRD